MISRRTAGWKLHDWAFLFILILFICPVAVAIAGAISPGAGTALHKGASALALVLQWVAVGLQYIVGWLRSL